MSLNVAISPSSESVFAPRKRIVPKTKTANAAGTERIAAQIGKGRFANVNSSIANADSTAAKLTAVNGIATYLANYATQKFAYLNTLPILNTTAKEIYYYHTDHLGSSAWITDSLGVAVQHLAYMPWGETFVSQKTSNFSTIFTFSGKEKDEETGYSYFGQRFYDSGLSIWLSADPMRGKYPSFTPYNYCANNPIRLIDPNGETIWIVGEDGARIKYETGMDTEKLTGFTKQVVETLNDGFDNSITANWMICELSESDFEYTIKSNVESKYVKSELIPIFSNYGNTDTFYVPDGGTILWNSKGTEVHEQNPGRNTSTLRARPEMGLLHELAHAWDHMAGLLVTEDIKYKGLEVSEWTATRTENMIRQEMGIPLRTHHDMDTNKKPAFPKLLDSNGNYRYTKYKH